MAILKNSYIIPMTMSIYIVGFAFTYVVENLALLYGDFGRNSGSSNNDEAMKQDDEALNALSLHFFRRV
jgi:hypothetical protein